MPRMMSDISENAFSVTIEQQYIGKTVKYYLFEVMKLSRRQVILLKKKERGILLDGQPVFVSAVLKERSILTLALEDEESGENILPIDLPMDILYEDEHIIALNKQAGIPTHPSFHHYTDTLANALAYYFEKKDRPFVFRAVNRLDRDTSGVVLVAKNKRVAAVLTRQMETRAIEKSYLALIEGTLKEKEGRIERNILRVSESIMLRRTDDTEGEYALTLYRVLEQKNNYTLVEAFPKTGRTHQLRVHFSSVGHPIVGDTMYGTASPMIKRQALHAHTLTFTHPILGNKMTIIAPLPTDICSILKENEFENPPLTKSGTDTAVD